MRIFRNVTQLEIILKEKSHWAFAMYDFSDKVIGLLYSCPSLSPCTPCVSCNLLRTGDFLANNRQLRMFHIRSARRTVDSKIDENRCKQIYELIQVMSILYRYITLTASNCSISLTVIYLFQWKQYNVV